MKKGILAVSFGTTHKSAREKNIDRIEQRFSEAYPGIPCYRAFTSDIIRRILEKRDGVYVCDVEQALRKMKQDGITHVYIQPTHIIDGIENQKARETAEYLESEFEQVVMGRPLLGMSTDLTIAAQAVWGELEQVLPDKALILMGHGSRHMANDSYEKLEEAFREAGHPNVFLATVEARPSIEDVIEKMKNTSYKKVLLAPFMLVAGEHAIHDMAGEKDSFLTKLTEEGYEVEVLLKGLGEYEAIEQLFLSHLEEIIKEESLKRGILCGVGVGPGDPELMTLKAVRKIKECDILAIPSIEKETCVAYQIAKQVIPQIEAIPCLRIRMPMTKDQVKLEQAHKEGAESIREHLEAGHNIVFLTIGDPTIYSTYAYLQKILQKQGYQTETISGVPAFCAVAARLGISLCEKEEALHICPASYGVEEALRLRGTKVLMKSGKEKKELKLLSEVPFYGVQNCGMTDEKMICKAEDLSGENSYYTTIIVKETKTINSLCR